MICLVNPCQRMFGYRKPLYISGSGKQSFGYISKNLYRFLCTEIAVPHPPAFVRWYRFRLSPGRQPLVNNLLISIQASGCSVAEKPFRISGSGKQSLVYISKKLYRFPCPETAIPHPPAFVRWYRFRLSLGRQPLVNNLLVSI